MDTTLRKCKKCEEEFDSIYEIDNGICDECLEKEITQAEASEILSKEFNKKRS